MTTDHRMPDIGINNIDNMEGREPVGAALTIGTKGPSGAPTDRDRFYFKTLHADANDRRPNHPAFAGFNEAPPERRRFIEGVIVAHKEIDCFQKSHAAQVLEKGWPSTPHKEPQCKGDGCKAVRWMGADRGGWQTIACPGRLCEYTQGEKPACKPYARLLFQVRWPKDEKGMMPITLVKFTTKSWNSISSLVGFFASFRKDAATFGVPDASLYGLTIQIQLGEKTSAAKKSRFPVITVSTRTDVQSFLIEQRRVRDMLEQMPRHALLTDESMNTEPIRVAEQIDTDGPRGSGGGEYRPRSTVQVEPTMDDVLDVEPE